MKRTLSVLHISESDADGGAAKSARSLHEGLRSEGMGSRMLVGRRTTADHDVRSIKRSPLWRAADRPFGAVTQALDLQYLFLPSSFGVARDPWFRGADILQLHNLHGSFFSFSALPFLARRLPTVWWIQDMWPFTGHVTYSYDCVRWRTGCGSCPYLGEYPGLRRDTTHLLWRAKRAVYARTPLTLVVSSRWLADLAAESPLTAHLPRRLIPNGVDLERFRPRSRAEARAALGVPDDLPVVLVFDGDRRKGAELFPAVLDRLAAGGTRVRVLVVGERGPWRLPAGVEESALGRIRDEQRLALAYAAADVLLFPTLADNLPNALLESLACGTPVVATAVGGVGDAVEDGETGRLVPPGDVAALADAVSWMVAEPERALGLGAAARTRAERDFGSALQTQRFLELYAELAEAA